MWVGVADQKNGLALYAFLQLFFLFGLISQEDKAK
jgi:hypothetical protein